MKKIMNVFKSDSKESEKDKENPNNEKKYDEARTVSIIIVGCGARGYVYSLYAEENPNRLKVTAVCDPIKYRREKLGNAFSVPNDKVFSDWKEIVEMDKFADAVFIGTPDQLHAEPAIAFANKGYHILVEKPMAVTQEDCNRMVEAAKRNNVIFAVCHVLRYTPYNLKIKSLIDEGYIGKVMNIQHLEPVGYYHNAHSYVRGNWKRQETSTFMLMAKSCHDIDLIHFFMNSKCKKISSFGSLSHFTKENKPKEAGEVKRCLDCSLQDKCPYSAKTIYLTHYPWKSHCLVPNKEPTIGNVKESLVDGPYGVCVYESDNDVVDQQIVNMEFEDGKTCSFSMIAFTEELCVRKTRIHGTHGQLICDGHTIVWDDFRMGDKEIFKPELVMNTKMSGHNCADYYLMRAFVYAVATNDPSQILSGPDDTLLSHTLVFAAEQSRVENRIVNIN